LSLAETLARFDREAMRGTCDTGRYRCRFFTWGEGPPLLFIPGLSSDARSFALVMVHLARHFRCIGYDLPTGQGDSAALDAMTHDDLVADAFALLDHLNVRQSYVFGFSFGSTIALAALQAHPERLPRAVLQSGFARRRLAPAEVLLARLARHWQRRLRQVPGRAALLRLGHAGPFAGLPPELWRFFVERSGATPIAAVCQRALLVHRLDLRPLLEQVPQPVLLVSGDGDPVVDAACLEALQRGLPNAGHIELTGCGHYALYSHSAPLAEAMRRFLTPPCG
jgi:pimeloyl-ACP methyl ester carboxylesterase